MAQHLDLALTLGGYLGGLLVLAGYALTSSGRLASTSPAAQAVSTTGALLLLANGVALAAWASVGVNAAWIAIGAVAVWRGRAGHGAHADAGAAGSARVPVQRFCDCADGAPEVWPGDWDAAAEHLATAAEPLAAASPAAATACPPTAPMPVLDRPRP
ncbi:hypothetical protein [uncultured Pseudokineococcus sp.]|uniref:CBU_0592 family membrane protein n=1 Tax=uncultured Pseudokineococcus sp. TaxID=1642928 RepID=UPI00262DC6DC|nr:hypothetical protein [uncultured Pseudokineococcus sp.]